MPRIYPQTKVLIGLDGNNRYHLDDGKSHIVRNEYPSEITIKDQRIRGLAEGRDSVLQNKSV